MPRSPKYDLPQIDLGDQNIGQRIAQIRKQQGLTQQQLAEKIGIERYLVSDYERGRVRLYDQMVARFAIALGTSADQILGLKTNGETHPKPSLRVMRRALRIQELPSNQQKALLRIIDGFLKSEGK